MLKSFSAYAIFVSLLVAQPVAAQSPDLHLRIESGDQWEMSAEGNDAFTAFLAKEMDGLRTQVPNLYWPTITAETNFKDALLSAFYPGFAGYKNRSFQCSFVQKVLNSTTGKVQERFAEITRHGQVCIQFDLPKDQWAAFTESLAAFFWSEKWLLLGGEFFSLEDLVIEAVGPTYRRPEFHIATRIQLDGYGWGYSDAELQLFQDNPVLARFQEIAMGFDPNSAGPFTRLGTDVEQVLSESPYGSAGIFQPSSKIYLANAWGPADIVDLMVHEYGHVFHGETNQNLKWDSDSRNLTIYSDAVHSESVAESFAWMVLRNVYAAYPEVKVFHIAKLQLFQALRPKDPHLVGATAVHKLFHSEHDGTYQDLRDYASVLDFKGYLLSHGFAGMLSDQGSNAAVVIPVTFSAQ
jgi:hypothetical protein